MLPSPDRDVRSRLKKIEDRIRQLNRWEQPILTTGSGTGGAGILTAGNGLTGGGDMGTDITVDVGAGTGITVNANDVAVNLNYAFTWTALHTFNAGATIAAGQNLNFGADVSIARKSANLLALAAGDSFQSTTYTSGLNGWNIGADGSAEFLNVRVRGELSASVFVLSEITATAGSFGVFKSAAALASDYTAPGSVGASNTMRTKNSLAGAGLLAVNDIIRIKSWNGTAVRDLWFTVTALGTGYGNAQDYTVRLESGTVSTTFSAGTAVADYGPSGMGFLLMSADGTIGSSANLSIATHAGAPWTTQTLRVRLGNLNGSYGAVSDLFGIGVGDYSGGNYMLYNSSSGFVIKGGGGKIVIDGTSLSLSADGGSYFLWMSGATQVGFFNTTAAANLTITLLRSETTHAALTTSEIQLMANATQGWAEITGANSPFAGLIVGNNVVNSTVPTTMLDVRGSGTFTTGVNVGTATGAATGQVIGSSGAGTFRSSGVALASNQEALQIFDATNGQDWSIYRPAATRDLVISSIVAGSVMTLTQAGQVKTIAALAPPLSPGSAVWAMDTSGGTTLAIANGATANPCGAANNFAGLIIIDDTTVTGQASLWLTAGGAMVLVSQTGTAYVQSSAPAAGKIGVYLNGSTQVEIKNAQGSSITFTVTMFRTRTSN